MNISYIILTIIAICVLFMLATVFHKQLKIALQFLVKTAIGGLGIIALNFLLSLASINIGVGINFLTLLIVGTLGIPGFITIYFTRLLL